MNLVNAKYGRDPGLKAYTHVSDQFAPFAIQTIPTTVSEAPYILDGLPMNETGKRIRDLPSKRLYVFDPANSPKELRGLLGGKVREGLITSNWPGYLHLQGYWPTLPRSDGHISCSQANTGGRISAKPP